SLHAQEAARPCGSLEGIDAYVDEYREMAVFDGVVLIAEGDSIVYHCAYGLSDYRFGRPVAPDTRFRIASLSKQFTDVAIGRMVDAGLVSLDSPLVDHLPDFPGAERITLRHLVEHTSGVPHTNDLAWMDTAEPLTLEQIVDGLSREPLAFEPGTDSDYSNGGYALLAAVIEAVSGRSFGRYLDEEFARQGFPSVGHEQPFAVVPKMAHRYAPGPVYGERLEAPVYITANRIGGGSMFADAEDVWRFFRAAYGGDLLAPETRSALFPRPADGDVSITGRSPGALAQVYMHFDSGLSVVTLSSNSGWPGSFNADIVSLYRGEDPALTSFTLDPSPLTESAAARYTGAFDMEQFGWRVRIEASESGLVFLQDDVRTAFARTRSGSLHLPIYDWLCDYEADASGFTCRQRDPDNEFRFVFRRARTPGGS
ncbi:MAG TPA: serine hydrolase domain-containing protein, partial [Gemmatimonadota bacterium]|nr:serine hydrolase domain-containing protein [Gemmatimonadota bacterium]